MFKHQIFLERSRTTFPKRNPFFLTRIKIKTHKNEKDDNTLYTSGSQPGCREIVSGVPPIFKLIVISAIVILASSRCAVKCWHSWPRMPRDKKVEKLCSTRNTHTLSFSQTQMHIHILSLLQAGLVAILNVILIMDFQPDMFPFFGTFPPIHF